MSTSLDPLKTPPSSTTVPQQETPIHLKTSTTSRFEATNYAWRDEVFATMATEMAPYFLGPMPVAEFLESFMPSDRPGSRSFKIDLVICNTSHSTDKTPSTKFPFLISPDFSVFTKNGDWKAGTNSSKVEFTIEYKPSYDRDAFVTELPSIDAPPDSQNPLMATGTESRKITGQITSYAASQLSAQYRTHAFSVLIIKDYARLIRWDRSGAIVTEPLYYNRTPELVDFFIRYNYANPTLRGRDETVRLPEPDEVKLARKIEELNVDDLLVVSIPKGPNEDKEHYYVIKPPIAEPYTPPGRGTRVSIACDLTNGKRVLLKDSWRVAFPEMPKEGDVYRDLKRHLTPNIPDCLASGDIGEDRFHLTQTQCFVKSSWAPSRLSLYTPQRHHRLALKDIGKPLNEFTCSYQMVRAIYASLVAHEWASKHGILHRDISPSNILITEDPQFDGGMLIDWDLCRMDDSQAHARQVTRTGTWQFMAADFVREPGIPHTFVHDLESTFFVLLWLSMLYLPNSLSLSLRSSMIRTIFSPPVFGTTGGVAKLTFLQSPTIMRDFSITDNLELTNLLHRLQSILAVRHSKPEKPASDLLNALTIHKGSAAGTSTSTSTLLVLETSEKEMQDQLYQLELDVYKRKLVRLENHRYILNLFELALASRLLEPSKSQMAMMSLGSKRSRQLAEIIGMSSSRKRHKSGTT